MRRPKSPAIIQVNLRLDADLVRQLETAAKARVTTLSQEVRERLIASFVEPSLSDSLTNFKHGLRDAIEHSSKDIEKDYGCLREVDAVCAHFYAAVENKLSLQVRYPRVRQVLRGTPALLEHKPSRR